MLSPACWKYLLINTPLFSKFYLFVYFYYYILIFCIENSKIMMKLMVFKVEYYFIVFIYMIKILYSIYYFSY